MERDGCARREEILDAATRLFAESGFTDCVTQQLADRLQVGKGTLYRYFPSKRELFLAAVDRVMRRMREWIDHRISGIDDSLDRLAAAVRAYLEFFAIHPEYVELLIQERAQFKDRGRPTYYEHRERNLERWKAPLRELMAEGRVREMPVERITGTLSDLVYGTMFTNYFNGGTRSPEDQAEDVMGVFLHGILSDAERSRRGLGGGPRRRAAVAGAISPSAVTSTIHAGGDGA